MLNSNNHHNKPSLHPISSKIIILLFSLILALIFTAYSNHFYNDFHFDDSHVIQTNTYIQNLKNIPLFFKDASLISSLPSNQQYRPMVATTLAIDYWLANGLNPFWFHVSIFTWFMIQCAFLYFFFLNIVNTNVHSRWNVFFSLFAMAFYGVHAANAETINYISARSDSMSTCWLIIAFVTFMKFPTARLWGAHLIPLIIACLFKQTAIVFPALLFLYVLFFEEQQGLNALFNTHTAKPLWINLFKSTGLTWLICIAMYIFVRKMDPVTFSPGGASVYLYLITQPFVMVHYFLTLFLPLQLSADTDWTTLTTIIDDRFYIGISFIIGLVTYAFYASKKQQKRPIAFGILWFFIALLPTSSVIPLAEVMNDHRLFFPLIGLLFATCYGVYLFILSKEIYFKQHVITKWILFATVFLILGGHAYGTYQRNIIWKTEESLWYDNALKNPKNGRGLMNYGLTQMSKGNYPVAEQYFLNALKYTPTYGTLHINLGIINEALGRPEEAEKYYENAIRYDNQTPGTLNFYGQFNIKRKPDIAEQALLKSLNLSPGDMETHHLLMQLYWEQAAWGKLNAVVQDALKLSPTDQVSRNYAHISEKKLDKIGILLKEIEQHPTAENYLSLSLLYFEKRNYPGVIKASKQAIKINPQLAIAYNNACAAYNELQEYTKAEIACKKAIAIDPAFQLAKNNLQASIDGKQNHG
jgi:tetratricopeptide (TPR) repeat protein